MAAARVGYDLVDVAGAVDRPLELLRDLGFGRGPLQRPSQEHLRTLVIGGRGHQQLCVPDRGGFGGDGRIHLLADLLFRERPEIGLAAALERLKRLDEAQRSFLNQVGERKSLLRSRLGQTDDHAEVGRDQACLALAVTKRPALEQPRLFPVGEWRGQACLLAKVAHHGIVAAIAPRTNCFPRHRDPILRGA